MDERKEKVREKIEEEEKIESMQLHGIKQFIWEILTKEKNFSREDIQTDAVVPLLLDGCDAEVSIDFIIHLPSASFMVIRCASVTMESWERYVVSFARVINKEYQIPYAVVTDGDRARVIDVLNGTSQDMSIHDIFTREEAIQKLEAFRKIPYPPEKREKTKRILYAFEGIKCPVPQDSDSYPK